MSDNKYFQKALSDFTAEFGYAGAVRHLHDLGYPPEQIKKEIDYPVSLEKIEKVIEGYEERKNSPESEYIYVQDTDVFGRKSFRRVKKENL